LSGASLTYAWAAEGALLAGLAWRIAEARFQLVSFAYLGLALGHALAFESRLDRLFDPNRHPGRGAPTIVAIAAAAAIETWFDRGHVAVSAAWALVGLAVIVAGLYRGTRTITIMGLAWLGVTLLKLGVYDALALDERLRSWSFLAVGACVLLAGYAYQLF